MPPDKQELIARASAAISSAGGDWRELLAASSELVIFGSTAAGLASVDSDLDILAIGGAMARKTRNLDLVVRSCEEIRSPEWLRSEMAGHIATYGVWVRGEGAWAAQVRVGEEALSRKWARIRRLVGAAERHWDRLDADFRRRSLVTIRRELQRAGLLEQSIPIPPTPTLDRRFEEGVSPSALPQLSTILGQDFSERQAARLLSTVWRPQCPADRALPANDKRP